MQVERRYSLSSVGFTVLSKLCEQKGKSVDALRRQTIATEVPTSKWKLAGNSLLSKLVDQLVMNQTVTSVCLGV